ncbi:SMP-30/gluconolactonase/LRE family protein [Cupriavidus sp. MP-37]|uniref:SMP-30/gluconolactonase/LRE family protein n=1 Tax=Cupriavidus sp. MP-37 TaxID=2884455 RepID=UPI001D0AED6B|nr:SMP-30/gluconolactonase/LRE family protein [Cupriavidus sp. MP-37]UDM52726.1 SMP-30/gluconolactonase/LRE family protein [Cupriavidus sp. MP-37]
MVTSIERVGEMRCLVGESPVWHPSEQALYWTDIPARTLWRWDMEASRADHWALPEMAGCLAMTASHGWLMAMESGLFRIGGPPPGSPLPVAECVVATTHAQPGMRFNDGRCDRQGRFWAGTMVMDMSRALALGRLHRFDVLAGREEAVIDDLIVPNGMAFSPDGKTMYLSDSHPSRRAIWAFDYNTDEGRPHNRRLFVDMNEYPGRPDGAAVDVDGCYWICANDGGQIHRFTPSGALDRSISLPVGKPAMCAFGGPRLDTLFVTTICPDGSSDPLAGAIFALNPGVQGIVETLARG